MRNKVHHLGMPHLRRLSLVEQTANLLREGLDQGRWRGQLPGVVRLAEALGVSTHTLRAALLLLETEGRVALSEDGRSRHVTAKGTADKHQLRIGILLYGPLGEDSPHTIHFMISLHHALEGEGFLPFFPPRTKPRCAGMSDGFVIT